MKFFDEVTPRRRLIIENRLKKLNFSNHSAFKYNLKLEGFKNFEFGARSGPRIELDNILHEIAHAVQFGAASFNTRVSENGSFVFNLKEVFVYNQMCVELETAQCTLREVETFAIQTHLLELCGKKLNKQAWLKRIAEICVFLPDEFNFKRTFELEKVFNEFYNKWSKEQILAEMLKWLNFCEIRLQKND